MLVGTVTHPDEIDQIAPFVDLIELRLDHFTIDKKPPYQSIFTLRKKEEGGVLPISEKERLARIEKSLEMEPEYCDLEADTDPGFIERIGRKFPKVRLIGSHHNFNETPLDLNALFNQMKNPHFSFYKIALKANSTADMLRLMIFARNQKGGNLSVMSMGKYGKPSRVLAPIAGSVLDYAGLKEEPQLHRYSVKTLLETFHYRRLSPRTRIYGLIGDPIEQSPGDFFHNPLFKQDAVYIKMALRGVEVSDFFTLIEMLPMGGLSVTIPIKEAVYSQMDEVTPIAEAIGAVNTVIFTERGKKVGTNTDAPGALNALEKHIEVKGKRLALLGAGGTARAIAYEAKQRGAFVKIFNRSLERGKALADRFGCESSRLDSLADDPYEILVNTIPPKSIGVPPIRPDTVVMDVVYKPRETPLLALAKKLNCKCVYGEEMFVEQALLQQKEWNRDRAD